MSKRTRIVVLAGLLVALFLAGGLSYYASSSPDGLNRVAIDEGFDKGEKDHALDDSPLSGYSLRGVDNERLSGGLAGILGVGLTFAVGSAIALAVRRRGADSTQSERSDHESTRTGGART